MDDRSILRALSRRNIRFVNDITLVSPLTSGLDTVEEKGVFGVNALIKSRMTSLSGQVLERTPPTKLNTTGVILS